MICVLALIVLGIASVFSASHRPLAKEAFNCVFRRVTLRKCQTGFDNKMKMKITGKIMKRSPKLSGMVFRHFEALSWIFMIIFFASLVYSAYSAYNMVVYGSCDPENPELCVITNGVSPAAELSSDEMAESCTCEFGTENCTASDYAACGTDCGCLEGRCRSSG